MIVLANSLTTFMNFRALRVTTIFCWANPQICLTPITNHRSHQISCMWQQQPYHGTYYKLEVNLGITSIDSNIIFFLWILFSRNKFIFFFLYLSLHIVLVRKFIQIKSKFFSSKFYLRSRNLKIRPSYNISIDLNIFLSLKFICFAS